MITKHQMKQLERKVKVYEHLVRRCMDLSTNHIPLSRAVSELDHAKNMLAKAQL